MAKIGDGTLKKWVDGADVDAVDINRNFEVLRVANNNTSDIASNAAGTIDSRIQGVQNDLNAKYTELVGSDEILETTLTETSAAIRSEFATADADLQTQVNARLTGTEADAKIAAAVATIVAGNAIIPVGSTLPALGNSRVDGEEFILTKADGTRVLYFYNATASAWQVSTKVIPIPLADSATAGLLKVADAGASVTDTAISLKGFNAHKDNTDIHVSSTDKNTWNGKQGSLENLSSLEFGLNVQGAGSRYLDFHTHPGSVDKHARIMATSNQDVDNGADLSLEAKSVTVRTKDNNNTINLSNIRINNGVFEYYDGAKWVATMGTSMVTPNGPLYYSELAERAVNTGYSDPNNVNTRACSILIGNHMVPAPGEITVFVDFQIGANFRSCYIFIGDRQLNDGRCDYDITTPIGTYRTFNPAAGTTPTVTPERYSNIAIADNVTGWRTFGTTFKVQHTGTVQIIFMAEKESSWTPIFNFKNVKMYYNKV